MSSIRSLLCSTLLVMPAVATDKKGDDPAPILAEPSQDVSGSTDLVAGFPPGCTVATASFANATSVPIPDLSTVTSTITVGSVGTNLWDVDLNVNIAHTRNIDLDVTLTAPDATVITITTNNGTFNDNIFAGTRFDDQAIAPCTDYFYANNVAVVTLCPEGALDAVRGIDPNGVWTLSITDEFSPDGGTLVSWSLDLTTISASPITSATSVTNSTPTQIFDLGTVSSTILVSGATGVITDVNLTTFITHTRNNNLDITLVSPSFANITLTTDNGYLHDDVFNGTVWDDQVSETVNDHVYANLVLASPLAPEGSLARLLGENPNGVWTLRIRDDQAGDVGMLNSWTLDLQSGDCVPVTPVAFCDPNSGGVIPCPCGNPASGANRGCDNSSATGGASLTASGINSLSADTLVFTTTGEKPTVTSIFSSWDVTNPSGSVFGQGVNCGAGTWKRLYVKWAVAGSAVAPVGADPSVSQRHANKGDPLGPGFHRYYNVIYRDAIVLGGCPPQSAFNLTSMLDVTWAP